MRPLSYSSISLYQQCPLLYKLRYVDGLKPKPRPSLSFGSSTRRLIKSRGFEEGDVRDMLKDASLWEKVVKFESPLVKRLLEEPSLDEEIEQNIYIFHDITLFSSLIFFLYSYQFKKSNKSGANGVKQQMESQ